MSVIRTKALILRHTTEREHDRMLTILTPALGQRRVRSRGTKKSVSKLGGSLEPLMEVDLTLADGRLTDVVTGSVILNRYAKLRMDIVTMTMAQWLMELVEAVSKPGQSTDRLYQMVSTMLSEMESEVSVPAGQRWSRLCRRALLIMIHEGFAPVLDVCSVCHRPLGSEGVIYHDQQGFVHPAEAHQGGLPLTLATLTFIRTGELNGNERDVWKQSHQLIERLIHHTLDRPLKSERVLRMVVRSARLPTTAQAR